LTNFAAEQTWTGHRHSLMRKLLLLGLLAALMGADAGKQRPPEVPKFRLVLKADDVGGFFFTAWSAGDVISKSNGADGKLVYFRRFKWGDGCEWVATEALKPIGPNKLKYTYRETPVSCPKGSQAATDSTTPRDGVVTVLPLDKDAPETPLDQWAAGAYGR
jgi:hypothetical protein